MNGFIKGTQFCVALRILWKIVNKLFRNINRFVNTRGKVEIKRELLEIRIFE